GGTPSDGVARPVLQVQDGDRRVEEQRYVANGETFRNLIVRLGPETEDRIVIGAHYDVRGPYPGADDNGSGPAALLELARVLRGGPRALAVDRSCYSER